MALWGGSGYTVNRVSNVYQDQLKRNGAPTTGAMISISRPIRYYGPSVIPCCGNERLRIDPISRTGAGQISPSRMPGIRPIAGVVHHGSGPVYATFDTPAFEQESPRYARAVAERYPLLMPTRH